MAEFVTKSLNKKRRHRRNIYIKNSQMIFILRELQKADFNLSQWIEHKFMEQFGKQEINVVIEFLREELKSLYCQMDEECSRVQDFYNAKIKTVNEKLAELKELSPEEVLK